MMSRYLGSCFNESSLEAYIISDYMVGCSWQDLDRNTELRELLRHMAEIINLV
jgi:hypothetical protein